MDGETALRGSAESRCWPANVRGDVPSQPDPGRGKTGRSGATRRAPRREGGGRAVDLLAAAADDPRALRELERAGFDEPARALANLHGIAPTPVEGALLAPVLPRLLRELHAAPDPDMALNNIERLAAQGDRAAFIRTLGAHPGAVHLLARLGGTSQFLADTLRRRPQLFPWLLEPAHDAPVAAPTSWRRTSRRPPPRPGARRRGTTRSAASSTASSCASPRATSWATPTSR